MQRHLLVLFLLALTQITGWGMVSVLPVIAKTVATEFQTSLPMIFIGTSVMFVAMGLAAPWTGRAFRTFGPRSVMAAGAGMIAGGLALPARTVCEPFGILGGLGVDRNGRLDVPDDIGLCLYRGLCRGSSAKPYRHIDAGNGSGG